MSAGAWERIPAAKRPPSSDRQAGRAASNSAGRPGGVEQAEVDVHAVAGPGGVQQRGEARAQLVAAGELAHDLSEGDGPIRAREPLGGLERDLELVRRELRGDELGLQTGLDQRGHDLGGEGFRAPQRLEREGGRRGRLVEELELVLEARQEAQAELVLELLQGLAQEAARAAVPRLAAGVPRCRRA